MNAVNDVVLHGVVAGVHLHVVPHHDSEVHPDLEAEVVEEEEDGKLFNNNFVNFNRVKYLFSVLEVGLLVVVEAGLEQKIP